MLGIIDYTTADMLGDALFAALEVLAVGFVLSLFNRLGALLALVAVFAGFCCMALEDIAAGAGRLDDLTPFAGLAWLTWLWWGDLWIRRGDVTAGRLGRYFRPRSGGHFLMLPVWIFGLVAVSSALFLAGRLRDGLEPVDPFRHPGQHVPWLALLGALWTLVTLPFWLLLAPARARGADWEAADNERFGHGWTELGYFFRYRLGNADKRGRYIYSGREFLLLPAAAAAGFVVSQVAANIWLAGHSRLASRRLGLLAGLLAFGLIAAVPDLLRRRREVNRERLARFLDPGAGWQFLRLPFWQIGSLALTVVALLLLFQFRGLAWDQVPAQTRHLAYLFLPPAALLWIGLTAALAALCSPPSLREQSASELRAARETGVAEPPAVDATGTPRQAAAGAVVEARSRQEAQAEAVMAATRAKTAAAKATSAAAKAEEAATVAEAARLAAAARAREVVAAKAREAAVAEAAAARVAAWREKEAAAAREREAAARRSEAAAKPSEAEEDEARAAAERERADAALERLRATMRAKEAEERSRREQP